MKYLILIIVIIANSATSFACDSTVLAMLTGSSQQERATTQLLAVTQKLQIEGNNLNAFNIEAAKNMHNEVMQNWLQIASEITVNPPVEEKHKKDFSGLMIVISRDLGKIRKIMNVSGTPYVHENIEATITRISMLGALINNSEKTWDFLNIELVLYGPRPLFGELLKIRKATENIDIVNVLTPINTIDALKSMITDLVTEYKIYQSLLKEETEKVSAKTLTKYQDCLNLFVKIKQQLLADKYFENV